MQGNHVGVLVPNWCVSMWVTVRFGSFPALVLMLVVFVVDM